MDSAREGSGLCAATMQGAHELRSWLRSVCDCCPHCQLVARQRHTQADKAVQRQQNAARCESWDSGASEEARDEAQDTPAN